MSLSRAAARVYGKGTPSNLGPGESEPRKCDRPKSIDIGELKDGDHIMVKHTVCNKKKDVTLFRHHLLIGQIEEDTVPLRGRTLYSRAIEVYDFQKRKPMSKYATSEVVKYKVYATAQRVGKDTSKLVWIIDQDDSNNTFQDYAGRRDGLRKIEHRDYEEDVNKVISRAEAACMHGVFDYSVNDSNCEHFVNACKGLMGGYGWSYQTKSKGLRLYAFDNKSKNYPVQESLMNEEDTITQDSPDSPEDDASSISADLEEEYGGTCNAGDEPTDHDDIYWN